MGLNMKFVVFKEINQRWYWELRHAQGEAVARSPMGFATIEKAFESIRAVRKNAPGSLVFDLIGTLFEEV